MTVPDLPTRIPAALATGPLTRGALSRAVAATDAHAFNLALTALRAEGVVEFRGRPKDGRWWLVTATAAPRP